MGASIDFTDTIEKQGSQSIIQTRAGLVPVAIHLTNFHQLSL